MKKQILILLAIMLFSKMTAQGTPSLTIEQIESFKTMISQEDIFYYTGAEQIVYVNPDIWSLMDFKQRKTFTENLCVYINRYVLRNNDWKSWWIQIKNMATQKKMAKWDDLVGYKEFN